MRRVLSIWFPSWSVDLARRRGAAPPILLVSVHAGRTLVEARCARSRDHGVRPGMPLAEARALLSPAVPWVADLDPARDLRQLAAIGAWAMRFSPVVSLDPPDGLLLDVAGSERLFGAEHELLRAVEEAALGLGLAVRLASAHTVGAAWALARFAQEPRLELARGAEREALAPLPVEGLRLADEVARELRAIGVTTVGALLALPRAKLPARFGEELLLRLDQALGRVAEPVERLAWRAPLFVEHALDGPVASHEVLLAITAELLAELLRRLAEQGLGAAELALTLFPSDRAPCVQHVPASRPGLDERLFLSLLLPRLEATDLGFGVERVTLEATRTHPMRERQDARWEPGADRRAERELCELFDVLTSRLGPAELLAPRAHASHVPERAFRTSPFSPAPRRAARGRPVVTASERPSLLFPAPEPLAPEGASGAAPPASFRLRGELVHTTHAFGPERIEEPWWEGARPRTRDYYRVETSLRRTLWVFRELESGRWFAHGEWA